MAKTIVRNKHEEFRVKWDLCGDIKGIKALVKNDRKLKRYDISSIYNNHNFKNEVAIQDIINSIEKHVKVANKTYEHIMNISVEYEVVDNKEKINEFNPIKG